MHTRNEEARLWKSILASMRMPEDAGPRTVTPCWALRTMKSPSCGRDGRQARRRGGQQMGRRPSIRQKSSLRRPFRSNACPHRRRKPGVPGAP